MPEFQNISFGITAPEAGPPFEQRLCSFYLQLAASRATDRFDAADAHLTKGNLSVFDKGWMVSLLVRLVKA